MLSLKTTILTSLVTIGLLGGPFERDAAAGGPGGPGGKGHSKVERLCKQLECTSDQATSIAAIGAKVKEESQGDHQALRDLKTKLAKELAKERPNTATVNTIFADMDRRQDAIDGRMQAALLQTHKLLTAEQRAEFAQMIERRGPKAMFNGGKGKHGGKGEHAGERERSDHKGKHGGKGKGKGHAKGQGQGKGKPSPAGQSRLG